MVFANRFIKAVNGTSTMIRRRRRFRRKFPRINNLMDVSGKIFGLQKQMSLVKGIINSERHYLDIGPTTLSVSNLGGVVLINAIAQGDDIGNRQGNSLLHKYLNCTFNITIDTTATASTMKIMVVVDTANQGVTPNVSDILQSISPFSMQNIDNSKRFIILHNHNYGLSQNGRQRISFKKFLRTGFHCKYSGAASTTVLQNAIYLLYVSDESADQPSLTYTIRNAFYDN